MVTVGASPATKNWPLAGVDGVSVTSNSGMLRASFTVQSCAFTIAKGSSGEPGVPVARWQVAHSRSSAAGPPGWLAPVTKSTLSWHEPHAARDGFCFQLSTFSPSPVWHLVQLASTAGKPTFHQSSLWLP
jgi:hypothetical protein